MLLILHKCLKLPDELLIVVDLFQMLQNMASDLDIHCLLRPVCRSI